VPQILFGELFAVAAIKVITHTPYGVGISFDCRLGIPLELEGFEVLGVEFVKLLSFSLVHNRYLDWAS